MVQDLIRQAERVAETKSTVFIMGETGTGKELLARAIHNRSAQRHMPLIKVNCAAIPDTLLESELFGHVRGAFTGATNNKKGKFALADGGTIFLDEIGTMSPPLQAKLLRVLQEREFEPLGAERTQRVEVRVIAATNRDVKRLVEEGKFLEDLFYRLNVIPFVLPPLRDRREDIPALAEHFLRKHAQRTGRKVDGLSEAALERLTTYDWPGNVRELENTHRAGGGPEPGPRHRRGGHHDAGRGGHGLARPALPQAALERGLGRAADDPPGPGAVRRRQEGRRGAARDLAARPELLPREVPGGVGRLTSGVTRLREQ